MRGAGCLKITDKLCSPSCRACESSMDKTQGSYIPSQHLVRGSRRTPWPKFPAALSPPHTWPEQHRASRSRLPQRSCRHRRRHRHQPRPLPWLSSAPLVLVRVRSPSRRRCLCLPVPPTAHHRQGLCVSPPGLAVASALRGMRRMARRDPISPVFEGQGGWYLNLIGGGVVTAPLTVHQVEQQFT